MTMSSGTGLTAGQHEAPQAASTPPHHDRASKWTHTIGTAMVLLAL